MKNEKGITLLALVVSVVVLIILAGISIGALLGRNGIIEKSQEARNKTEEMQNSTARNRDALYNELTGGKAPSGESGAGTISLELGLEKPSETSIKATANITGEVSEIVSCNFYIKKTTEDEGAYVRIKKDDKLATTAVCTELETDVKYTVKAVVTDKKGLTQTAKKSILLGNAIKLSVKQVSEANSYPSVLLVTAESVASNMDYIELPDGTKINTDNTSAQLKTTYNSTKNGPISFTAYDKEGNSKQLEYMEQGVINFETEWTIANDNTTVTVPVSGAVDVYIDYGDGAQENIKTSNPTHTYNAGTYTMKISGKCTEFDFNSSTRDYLTGLKQWGCLGNTFYAFAGNLKGTYSGCANMVGNIPTPHEKSFQNITSFRYTFYNCSGLTGNIPENLFAKCPNATTFESTFERCSGLTGSIPENLFANCPNVKKFGKTFYNCSGLIGNIPENLFANCPNVTDFGSTFYGCSGLIGSIPENLFAKCPNVTIFYNTFFYCNELTGSIPEKLFANCPNATTFESTFRSCSGLTGSIPENLFANCPNVTSFYNTFYYCNELTGSIPENLFANCPNVTKFWGVFSGCKGLTGSIPENLFAKCPNATDFTATFSSCSGLTGSIPENLFANCPNIEKLGSTSSNVTYGTFSYCTGLTGNAPDFWNTTSATTHSYCFYKCTQLGNYADIPDDWK